MKIYYLLGLIPLFVACSNKSIQSLEANAKNYNDFSNSDYLINDKVIANFTLSNNRVRISLITKDRMSDVSIVECQINKRQYSVIESSNDGIETSYIIELQEPLKHAKIECNLSDGTTIKKRI